MKYVITCNENAQSHLIYEIKHHPGMGTLTWLTETEAILDSKLPIDKLNEVIRTTPIVFIRHLFEIIDQEPFETAGDLIERAHIDKNHSFAIQIRSEKAFREEAVAFRNDWADQLVAQGYTLDVKNPERVISLYFHEWTIYYGYNTPQLQLSKWSGGMIHFSRDLALISRAEFKLREVFDVFNIPVDPNGLAVDLGAAPGGWTWVLQERGYHVIAVDPAKLDPRVAKLKGVTHYKDTAQHFLDSVHDTKYAMVVNDMKMSSKLSVELFANVASHLEDHGWGIITIKMGKNFQYTHVLLALAQLRKSVRIEAARQLFHNRSEFTVIVRKR